ncbi:hypothetical protein RDV89_08840 [Nocardioides zeae]|uniref:DUF2975 domain-containing protein n=1 Tax=Nocardioides imazamoxiresistens TaxID=3231893 RepID=A0ABU3PWG7_9ACTN|nr:hypothetical protein [Nocardioides zeae]MDT9593172.1 hypothetical protein [Nocardioides zeae]
MTLRLTRTPRRPWARLLAVLLLHGVVMAVVAYAFIAEAALTDGVEADPFFAGVRPGVGFAMFVASWGIVAFAAQVACAVARRGADVWVPAAVGATALTAALQGWIVFLVLARRLLGGNAPVPEDALGNAVVVVLQVLAGHAFAVLLAVALVHACGGVEQDVPIDEAT